MPADMGDEFFGKGFHDVFMNKNPLDGDAGLAGVGKAAGRTSFRGKIQIRVEMDDDAGVATQFKDGFLLNRFAFEHPTHLGTAGKG